MLSVCLKLICGKNCCKNYWTSFETEGVGETTLSLYLGSQLREITCKSMPRLKPLMHLFIYTAPCSFLLALSRSGSSVPFWILSLSTRTSYPIFESSSPIFMSVLYYLSTFSFKTFPASASNELQMSSLHRVHSLKSLL